MYTDCGFSCTFRYFYFMLLPVFPFVHLTDLQVTSKIFYTTLLTKHEQKQNCNHFQINCVECWQFHKVFLSLCAVVFSFIQSCVWQSGEPPSSIQLSIYIYIYNIYIYIYNQCTVLNWVNDNHFLFNLCFTQHPNFFLQSGLYCNEQVSDHKVQLKWAVGWRTAGDRLTSSPSVR